MKKRLFFSLVMATTLMLLAACGKKEAAGVIDEALTETEIADILLQADKYAGKQIVISGKITMECGSGCWFYVNDGSQAEIYVDLGPAGLAIPQWVGRNVKVMGKVVREDNRIIVNATGVRLQ